MTKGKYRRKRKHTQQQAEQKASKVRLHEGEVVATEKHSQSAQNGDSKRNAKKAPPMGFRERVHALAERSSLTDWIIALFTFVLAAAAIYQFIIMNGQLGVMRIDQRAWLKPETAGEKPGDEKVSLQITSGQAVTYPLRVLNTGKTPAMNVDMKIFVEIVDSRQEPPLDHVDAVSGYPYGHITAGIIFPNSDFKQEIFRPSPSGTPQLATGDEVKSIREGKAYLAVFGIIKYDDVFKTRRWTKFCHWIATNGAFHAEGCTKYNAVDDN